MMTSFILQLAVCLFGVLTSAIGEECDQLFSARPDDTSAQLFHAPALHNPHGYTRKCLLKFIAPVGFRVKVSFRSSHLRGTYPECNHEYIDIFSELRQLDGDLLATPFGGRYCGRIAPRPRVSLYRGLVLALSTDQNNTDETLFNGQYQYINASRYEIGEPVSNSPCSFIIDSEKRRKGTLMSPTYPGVYPKGLDCEYLFIGQPGQRVRVEFRDFDLFMGGYHCPFDSLRIYDGRNRSAPLIGTFCQPERNLVKYSTGARLLITFGTIQRRPNPEKRGFYGVFEFSNTFVDLGFITGTHILGTECDQRILSQKESSGKVFSPNYPYLYQKNIVCKYFIYGMKDSQHLERVRIEFEKFDIAGGDVLLTDSESSSAEMTAAASGASSAVGFESDTDSGEGCMDGYLRIYLRGQEVKDAYDKYDEQLCGQQLPAPLQSSGPRFALVFSSGDHQASGFKANYKFETEYLIPGTAAPDGSCSFFYQSSSPSSGEFNSPRHPANYPSSTTCSYTFSTQRGQQVRIVFDAFKVRADHINGSTYGDGCHEDWLEMYNVFFDNRSELIGRFCDMSAPGPTESIPGSGGIRIVLHTDEQNVYSGFKGRYIFHKAKDLFADCGLNISGRADGVIESPNFPANYPARGSHACNWFVHARAGRRLLLHFDTFVVEGDRNSRGCPAAVVRVWRHLERPPLELCGDGLRDQYRDIVSDTNAARVSFVSAEKSVGNKGFRVYWTEIDKSENCAEFQCAKSGYCLPDSLRCNQRKNCGMLDDSDEQGCETAAGVDVYLAAGVVASVAAGVLLLVCVWCRGRSGARAGRLSPASRRLHLSVEQLGSRLSTMDTV